jgi:hypothetical protein
MEESARYELAQIEAFSMSTQTHFGRRKRDHGSPRFLRSCRSGFLSVTYGRGQQSNLVGPRGWSRCGDPQSTRQPTG